MKNKILQLEKEAIALEPQLSIRQVWDDKVHEYSNHFLDNIEDIKAYNFQIPKG